MSGLSSRSKQSTADFYLAEKRAGRVREDDSISIAEKGMVEKTLTQQK